MQTMHTGIPLVNEAEELKRFTGIEFALVHSQPPTLFIIHKRHRVSPDEVHPLTAYFIMNNRIYQSPDVYTLISNRLLTSIHSLQTSMDTLRTRRPTYTPRTGFVWPISDPTLPEDGKKHDGDTEGDAEQCQGQSPAESDELPDDSVTKRKTTPPVGDGKKRQNNMLLFNAMRTTALHANQSFTLPPTAAEKTVVESPVAGTGRSSPTPAPPVPQRAATPKSASSAPTPQEPVKGQPGAGKKKKKRTSLAPPPGQAS